MPKGIENWNRAESYQSMLRPGTIARWVALSCEASLRLSLPQGMEFGDRTGSIEAASNIRASECVRACEVGPIAKRSEIERAREKFSRASNEVRDRCESLRAEVMRGRARDRVRLGSVFMPCRSRPGEIRRELRSHTISDRNAIEC